MTGRGVRPGGFGYHHGLSGLLATVAGLVALEGVVVDVLLMLLWPGAWSWVVLGLHVYGLVWIGCLAASYAGLPHRLDGDVLVLRDGVHAELAVPRAAVRGVRALSASGDVGRSGLVVDDRVARMTHPGPRVLLELDPDVEVRGVEGGLRSLTVSADDPTPMVAAVRAWAFAGATVGQDPGVVVSATPTDRTRRVTSRDDLDVRPDRG